jgi:hypothetical protein
VLSNQVSKDERFVRFIGKWVCDLSVAFWLDALMTCLI